MVVSKFGGSSVASSEQFEKVKKIILADSKRQIIVTSAPGKRNSSDNKITDLLYLVHAHLQYSVSSEDLFEVIRNRYVEIEKALNLKTNIAEKIEEIRCKLDKRISADYLVSRGEYLCAQLLADYIGYKFVDAKEIIVFDFDSTINYTKTAELTKYALNEYKNIVVPGFYGSMLDGTIKLMKRGGSDITGSILSKVSGAEYYENWTDVSGILMTDPKIISNPKQIEKITYSELHELSYMGANVLHEDAILPVKDANIPIFILNTNMPESNGTMIVESISDDQGSLITGIAGKKDFTVITMYRQNSSKEVGLLRKTLEVFEKYNVSIEHIPASIDSYSIVVSTEKIENCIHELISELKHTIHFDDIKVSNNLSLIAVVGRNLAKNIGVSGRIFSTLGKAKINIRMIAQSSDEINITIGVENDDFEEAIKVLYSAFAEEKK